MGLGLSLANPTEFFLDLAREPRPRAFKIPEKIYPDIGWFNANRASNRIYHAVNGIRGLVIHATAGASTVGALSWWKQKDGAKASTHWIIPDEDEAGHGKEILAVIYESLAAWHVRNSASHTQLNHKTKINHWTLGVELVNRQDPTDLFSQWQIEATALLTRYCWAKYPNFRYVFSHAFVDPNRRSDPGPNFDWEQFQHLVLTSDNDPQPDTQAKAISNVANAIHIPASNPAKPCSM